MEEDRRYERRHKEQGLQMRRRRRRSRIENGRYLQTDLHCLKGTLTLLHQSLNELQMKIKNDQELPFDSDMLLCSNARGTRNFSPSFNSVGTISAGSKPSPTQSSPYSVGDPLEWELEWLCGGVSLGVPVGVVCECVCGWEEGWEGMVEGELREEYWSAELSESSLLLLLFLSLGDTWHKSWILLLVLFLTENTELSRNSRPPLLGVTSDTKHSAFAILDLKGIPE